MALTKTFTSLNGTSYELIFDALDAGDNFDIIADSDIKINYRFTDQIDGRGILNRELPLLVMADQAAIDKLKSASLDNGKLTINRDGNLFMVGVLANSDFSQKLFRQLDNMQVVSLQYHDVAGGTKSEHSASGSWQVNDKTNASAAAALIFPAFNGGFLMNFYDTKIILAHQWLLTSHSDLTNPISNIWGRIRFNVNNMGGDTQLNEKRLTESLFQMLESFVSVLGYSTSLQEVLVIERGLGESNTTITDVYEFAPDPNTNPSGDVDGNWIFNSHADITPEVAISITKVGDIDESIGDAKFIVTTVNDNKFERSGDGSGVYQFSFVYDPNRLPSNTDGATNFTGAKETIFDDPIGTVRNVSKANPATDFEFSDAVALRNRDLGSGKRFNLTGAKVLQILDPMLPFVIDIGDGNMTMRHLRGTLNLTEDSTTFDAIQIDI